MSNHSAVPFEDFAPFMRGATGQFPNGKLTEHDEGEIQFAVGERGENVIIDFGKPVAWFAMSAEQAEGLADCLRDHAREVRQRIAHNAGLMRAAEVLRSHDA